MLLPQAYDLAVLTLQTDVTAVGGYFDYDCFGAAAAESPAVSDSDGSNSEKVQMMLPPPPAMPMQPPLQNQSPPLLLPPSPEPDEPDPNVTAVRSKQARAMQWAADKQWSAALPEWGQ